MPKKKKNKRSVKKSPSHHAHKQNNKKQQNLIDIENQTIVVYNAGDKNVNGVYEYKFLDEHYFQKIGSIQSYKHSSNQQQTNNDDNKNNQNNDINTDNNKPLTQVTQPQPQSTGKYEIDRHEYLTNPDKLPHSSLNKSGVWIISRTDCYPKQLLYAVNCPFKTKINTNNWITLTDGIHPAPKIKLFTINKDRKNQNERDINANKKKKNRSKTGDIKETINNIRNDHHNTDNNKLNDMQLKSMTKNKTKNKKVSKLMIVSGGQTGVDRAALDVAIALNIPYSGWIPKGRKAEDGIIDIKYDKLKECNSDEYDVRTLLNVVDSDATLILNIGKLDGGTLTTKKYVSQKNKDLMYITLHPIVSKPIANATNTVNDVDNDIDNDNQDIKINNDNDNNNDIKTDNNDTNDNDNSSNDDAFWIHMLKDNDMSRASRVSEWIRCSKIKILNVAGPRESNRKGMYESSVKFLTMVLQPFKNGNIPRKSLF